MEYPQYKSIPHDYIKHKIEEFLLEDCPSVDLTTQAIYDMKQKSRAILQAQEDMIFAGKDIISVMFGDSCELKLFYQDGFQIKNNEIIAEIFGQTSYILTRERVFLNLLQRICGIASLTNKYVEIASPYNVKILDTRKTTPGLRLFEKFAVTAGGGYNHRFDLSSGILIKDNHIKDAGSITQAVKKIKTKNYGFAIELEVESFDDIEEGLSVGVDGFLLDNMTPENVIKAVGIIRNSNSGNSIFIEASGGITLTSLPEYVATGVNAISIGALTHSAKSSEIHLEFL